MSGCRVCQVCCPIMSWVLPVMCSQSCPEVPGINARHGLETYAEVFQARCRKHFPLVKTDAALTWLQP
jgi:hypothetical protein